MKKLITIVLLTVHLFNLGGQLAVHQYLVCKADNLFNEQINNNKYRLDDLVEVKIPVKMPTIQDWTEYASISGQVQFKTSCYNYVKLKMTRDTIYLMCVPNYKTTRLIDHNIIDARNVADIPVNKKDHAPAGKTNNISVFNYQVLLFRFSAPVVTIGRGINTARSNTVNSFISRPGQPPDLA